MESFFSSLKTERIGNKTYRTRDEARADVFDYIERFYNTKRRQNCISLTPCHSNRGQAKEHDPCRCGDRPGINCS
jgi:putative transposase